MSDSILDYFPKGMSPRDVQRDVLLEIQRRWNQYDVFVVNAPVASGKSAIAYTIAAWQGRARIATPTNILVDQYSKLVKTVVKSSTQGTCSTHGQSCKATNKLTNKYCKGCPYPAQFRKGKDADITVSTYHMINAMRAHRKVHIFDEAHNLLPFLRDQHTKKIWPHKYGVPEVCINDWTRTRNWLITQVSLPEELDTMLTEMYEDNPIYIYEYGTDVWLNGGTFNGLKYQRGEAVEVPVIYKYPVNINMLSNPLWYPDSKKQKLVLMSATISKIDLIELGLDRRRSCYLEAKSPIDIDRRPIFTDYVGNINYGNMGIMLPRLVEKISMILQARGDKGMIHMPYSMASRMQKLFNNPRLIYHDKNNIKEKLKEFQQSDDKVLVGSGLYEGLSLDYDLSRWQVIAKVPWPSLASPLQQYWIKHDPDYYSWSALKLLMQASGRVCRTPTDYGETYILDSSFDKLKDHRLSPGWFKEAILID